MDPQKVLRIQGKNGWRRLIIYIQYFILFLVTILGLFSCKTAEPSRVDTADNQTTCFLPEELDPLKVFDQYKKRILKEEKVLFSIPADPCHQFYEYSCRVMEKSGYKEVIPMVNHALSRKLYLEQRQLLCQIKEELFKGHQVLKEDEISTLVTLYQEKSGFNKRLQLWLSTLEEVKKDVLLFFRQYPLNPGVESYLNIIVDRASIATDYTKNPSMLFETSAVSKVVIFVGGELTRTLLSKDAIYFILAHEMSHLLLYPRKKTFPAVEKCLQGEIQSYIDTLSTKVSSALREGVESEIGADYLAHQIFAFSLKGKGLSQSEKLEKVSIALRATCGYGGSNLGHPKGRYRINFLSSHPELNTYVCPNQKEITKPYCPLNLP